MNKKQKRFIRIAAFFMCIVLCCSMSITAFAAPATSPDSTLENGTDVAPRAEELEWIYRIHNGNYERRLWSYTYGVWRTDWIIVGPAPTT